MCGRVYVKTSLETMLSGFAFARRSAGVEALANGFPLWNGAPSLEYPIIVMDTVREPDVMGPVFRRARWGFVHRRARPPQKGDRPPPINIRCEGIATNGLFRDAYASRRALMPIDGFFEWRDVLGTGKNKQPYAVAMKDGRPFALGCIWDTWRNRETGDEFSSFAIITCPANELVSAIHHRMPVVIGPQDYRRWLSDEPDPRDLMVPYPSELMTMWPVDRKVGSPKYNTPDIIDEIELEEPGGEPGDPELPL